jgi:2-polyprenyl-3-methyl-5-hydroxy-6-metoxy-1,4-benzoquinol methylase
MGQISRFEELGFIVETLKKMTCKKVLDIGAGFGLIGFLIRGYIEEWNNKNSNHKRNIKIDAVERDTSYYNFQKEIYDDIFTGDVLKLNIDFNKYDTVICFDVVQHLDKLQGLELLRRLISFKGDRFLSIPLGKGWIRHCADNNESHLSEWRVDELIELGFNLLKSYNIPDGRTIGLLI